MRAGKLTPDELNQYVFRHLTQRRPEVILRSALGEDSTLIDLENELCVMSTDPITGAGHHSGWLAVHVSANDVASNGAEPVCCLLTILAPPDASLHEIELVMQDAAQAANEVNIEISGGHTEFTDAVTRIVLSTTVVGRMKRQDMLATDGAKAEDDIIVTKTIGLEGTAILATDAEDSIRQWCSQEELLVAKEMIRKISVVPEARIATSFGVHAMHDITEGGLLGALFEMASGAGLGFRLHTEQIPVHPLTACICSRLNLDVLRFLSSGSMLISSPNGSQLVELLQSHGIEAQVIGRFTTDTAKEILVSNLWTPVEPPDGDELWRGLAKLKKA